MKRLFNYYEEENKKQTFSLERLQVTFDNDNSLDEQKENGTTFQTWLQELIKMQILVETTFDNEFKLALTLLDESTDIDITDISYSKNAIHSILNAMGYIEIFDAEIAQNALDALMNLLDC